MLLALCSVELWGEAEQPTGSWREVEEHTGGWGVWNEEDDDTYSPNKVQMRSKKGKRRPADSGTYVY